MFRINVDAGSDFLLVLEELVGKLSTNDIQSIYISDKPNSKGEQANSLCGRSVNDLGFKNGDLLFVTYESTGEPQRQSLRLLDHS